jgi:hypothetical protein
MSGGELQPPPTRGRDATDVSPNGRFEFTQELTLRRLTDPLLFVAYAENGRQMAIKSVMPGELGESLNFVLQPTASVTARFDLPPGTPLTANFGALWTDEKGRWIGETRLKVSVDAESGLPVGEAVGCLPPGDYQVRVSSTRDTDELTAHFSVEPGNPQVVLSRSRLRPSQLASLRGQPAPELAATPMPPSELKPLSSLHGQVVVLNFWIWLGDKLNDHPEQTPFFMLPRQFKDKPVYWIAVHNYRVHDPEGLAKKVAGMRQAIWGDGPAPFASLIDESEPAPPVEVRARTATEGGAPDTRRGVTRDRYGLFQGLVLIDRQGRVVGSYSQEELEPALRRLLESED